MPTHNDYPNLIKVALQSDRYWQLRSVGVDEAKKQLAKPSLSEVVKTLTDQDRADTIASLVLSVKANDPMYNVPFGEELPDTSARSVLKLVIDQRHSHSSLLPAGIVINMLQFGEYIATLNYPEGRTNNRFNESIDALYHHRLPLVSGATYIARSGLTRVMMCSRSVYYAHFDQETQQFLALSGSDIKSINKHMNDPDIEGVGRNILLDSLPSGIKVGEVITGVNPHSFKRIVSAELCEPSGIVWKNRGNVRKKKKKNSNTKNLTPARLALRSVQ